MYMLLGAEIFFELMSTDQPVSQGTIFTNTSLGCIVSGPMPRISYYKTISTSYFCGDKKSLYSLEDPISKFWQRK